MPTPDLWTYSKTLYSEPGVEQLCLKLQDEQGVNVLVLLWCSWLESWTCSLSVEPFREALRIVDSVSDATVVPLRSLRRSIKASKPVPESVGKQVRTSILDAELVIERYLLEELEKFACGERCLQDAGDAKETLGEGRVAPLDRLVQTQNLKSSEAWLTFLRAAGKRTLHVLLASP